MWEQFPQAMNAALERHDAIMRASIAACGGTVFKTIGDAFCAAFDEPSAAVQSAINAQITLDRENQSSQVKLRVRMAVYTGEAHARDDDYFGQALNRVARLLALGHGGQVLVAAPTMQMVGTNSLEQANILSLGIHRLRDVEKAEEIFQVTPSSLPAEFPQLRSMDVVPNNLPREASTFIGREREIVEIRNLLSRSSLLTLTGSGGCGKTRLAVEVASQLLRKFPDGVWVVELASIMEPSHVAGAVASAMSLHEEAGKDITETLKDFLRQQNVLIVLDNCEHLVEACARLADTLLRSCAQLKILATSREAIGVPGETTWNVPSLSVPEDDEFQSATKILSYEAVRLFAERATQSQSTFILDEANCHAVAKICRRLDGIPLALELAAARVKSLGVEDIAARLDDRFRLLTGGSRTALPRQQTLRATIDWSYRLLEEPEKLMLRRLSVFYGGWTLEAAEAITAEFPYRRVPNPKGDRSILEPNRDGIPLPGIEDWEVLDLMTQLVDKSLVVYDQSDAHGRYRMLETVRQYSQEKLFESDEAIVLRGRHLQYMLELVEDLAPQLGGGETGELLNRLAAEHDNIRSALDWCSNDPEGTTKLLRLARSLHRFWETRGFIKEGRMWLERAIAAGVGPEYEDLRMRALNNIGTLCTIQGDYQASKSFLQESLLIARNRGFKFGIAIILNNLGLVEQNLGEYDEAQKCFAGSVMICREEDNRQNLGIALDNLGAVYFQKKEVARAKELHQEAYEIFTELRDMRSLGIASYRLSEIAFEEGDEANTRKYLRDSISLLSEIGHKEGLAAALEAYAKYLCTRQSRPERAVEIFAMSEKLRRVIGSNLAEHAKQEIDEAKDSLRARLGDEVFNRSRAIGSSNGLEETIVEIMNDLD